MADNYEKEIRRRIEQRYKKRSEFAGMLISLAVMNAGIWFLLHPTGAFATAAQCFLGISVIALGITSVELLMNEMKEAAIQREIDAERAVRMGSSRHNDAYEKTKNRPVRLVQISDDGELLEIEDDADDDGAARRRR